MLGTADIRKERAERDVETLRTTMDAVLDRHSAMVDLLSETRDIAIDNRSRLDRFELRLDMVDN